MSLTRPAGVVALVATVLALALAGATVAAGAGKPAAAGSASAQSTDADAGTTTVVKAASDTERSAPITVLLVGLGAAAGVLIGLLPAFAAALLLGYVGPQRRAARASGVLVEPPRAPPSMAPVAVAPAVDAPPVAEVPPPDAEPRTGQVAVLAHARHQAVYDAAYAEQLDRVAELRAAIGTRLGDRRPNPPAD